MTTTNLFIKRSIKSAASLARAGVLFPRANPGSINIFAYHRVVSDIAKAEREAIYGIVVSTDTFRRHCELLRRSYDVVSLETAMHFIKDRTRVARPLAVITFDDGYLDFYEEAFPILNELAIPATVFLPTECIGQPKPLAHDRLFWLVKLTLAKCVGISDALISAGLSAKMANKIVRSGDPLEICNSLVYLPNTLREKIITRLESVLGQRFEDYPLGYQLLTWDMVTEMSRKGINFGSHTANHVVLPLESDAVIRAEIAESKKTLERRLGVKAVSFAYPNGEYNAAIRAVTAQAGFKVAVTTETRFNTPESDLLALGRISLCEESTRGFAGRFSSRVAGLRLGIRRTA